MMPATQHGAKRDESDFEFQVESMDQEVVKSWNVAESKGRLRVFDVPARHKSVSVGAQTTSVLICLHGRLVSHPCSTCEFEAPKLIEKGRES